MTNTRLTKGPRALGLRGEDLAADELTRQGLEIVARNWRCRHGELDIVARETVGGRTTIVFCEVKCRAGLGFGAPLEAITYAKLRRLRQLAGEWLAQTATAADAVRLDAIGIVAVRGQEPRLTHARGIG